MTQRFDSVIFDLDGTLWNASESVTKGFQAAKNSVDYIEQDITLADVQAVTGQPYELVYDRLFPTLPADRRQEFKALCARHELGGVEQYGGNLYPGLEDALRYLTEQGYRLFIVSNCQRGYIEAFFQHSQLAQYFEGHQCFGTKNLPKFQNILEVIEQHSLQAPVYVGDTRGDFEASQKSGIPFIFATYGFGEVPLAEAPMRIDSLADLQKLL
ncbi:HAD family hydrolase [uncultured Hymenobacter sp.]|uniref:HAD family hydrolase n=1 Tax=uncultured Hymenobacter sp. TaxID=170016 RepID=UPI0035CC6BA2